MEGSRRDARTPHPFQSDDWAGKGEEVIVDDRAIASLKDQGLEAL